MSSNKFVLGINASHNGSASIVSPNGVSVAIQEERLSGRKYHRIRASERTMCVPYCLDAVGISAADLSAVVVCPQKLANRQEHDLYLNPDLRIGFNKLQTYRISHHFGHALGAFFSSGFESAACLVLDGVGSTISDLSAKERVLAEDRGSKDSETVSYYHIIRENTTECRFKEYAPFDNWLERIAWKGPACRRMPRFRSAGGMFASVATCIFGDRNDAGKVMGLAAYGEAIFPPTSFFEISKNGIIWNDSFADNYQTLDRWPQNTTAHANLAASVQVAFEILLRHHVNELARLIPEKNICYAGGLALNSVANQKILYSGPFENVFIMPSADDSGVAIGAAYYGLIKSHQIPKTTRVASDSLGKIYTDTEIKTAIARTPNIQVRKQANVAKACANDLGDGKVVAWFQGGSEFGPRALGYRSILLDPTTKNGKDLLNQQVKGRERFRPFAAAILAEHTYDWIQQEDSAQLDAPFMQRVLRWRNDKKTKIGAVVHQDGTGRIQTVSRGNNELFYELLCEFYSISGVPLLLNTSFNYMGEPIVETPDNAIWELLMTGIDVLYLGPHRIEKKFPSDPIGNLIPRVAKDILTQIPVSENGLLLGNRQTLGAMQSHGFEKIQCGDANSLNALQHMDGRRDVNTLIHVLEDAYPSMTRRGWRRLICTLKRRGLVNLTNTK